MAKGTARAITNVKPMAGGVAITTLQIGDYAYGTAGATDLTGFTHLYRKGGLKVELGASCKATIANLTITNETETTPPPVDPPVTDVHIYPERLKLTPIISGVEQTPKYYVIDPSQNP